MLSDSFMTYIENFNKTVGCAEMNFRQIPLHFHYTKWSNDLQLTNCTKDNFKVTNIEITNTHSECFENWSVF